MKSFKMVYATTMFIISHYYLSEFFMLMINLREVVSENLIVSTKIEFFFSDDSAALPSSPLYLSS